MQEKDKQNFPALPHIFPAKVNRLELESIGDLHQRVLRFIKRDNRFIALFFEREDDGELRFTQQEGITKASALVGLECQMGERNSLILPSKIGEIFIQRNILSSAVGRLHPGDAIGKLIEMYTLVGEHQTSRVLSHKYPQYLPTGAKELILDEELSKILLKVHMPRFEKKPGKKYTKTFDRMVVKINVPVCGTIPNLPEYLRKNQKKVKAAVLKSIQNYKNWQKYEYPLNQMRLISMQLKGTDDLIMIFEPKTKLLPNNGEN